MLRVSTLLALGASALLAGCMGSPEPYRPYHSGGREARPDPAKRAAEEAELRLETELPVEIARNEAELERGRKTIRRILGEIPRNPWTSYARNMVKVLDKNKGLEHAGPYLPPGPPERRALSLGTFRPPEAGKKAAADADDDGDYDD
ncbi:MAG: hypothetical protein KF878_23875 [Planctomycetes bacterium]|nr:hypothetical protein [Planctomycetota bacterium]